MLSRGTTAADLAHADPYPHIAKDEVGEWLDHCAALVPSFEAAARDGDAMAV